jgi:hypothetical protein
MNMDDRVARVVEARMKLRERFLHDVEATPSIADDRQVQRRPMTGAEPVLPSTTSRRKHS